MPTCNPIIPAQPSEARYGISELYTSPRLTRPIYEEKYGEQAPAYDPKRQIKRWFFTDVLAGSMNPASETCEIQVFVSPNTIKSITMTKAEAAMPNLPGTVVYPKYTNSSVSSAIMTGPDGTPTPLGGDALVDLDMAKNVVQEINAQLQTKFTLKAPGDPWPWKITWGYETRRRMLISNGAQDFDAAAILRNRFDKGVGAPGKWSLGPDGGPVFTPDVPADGEQDVRPEIPMPCRPLLANERFATVFPGSGAVIERTDLAETEVEVIGGGLTTEQDQMLRDIFAGVRALRGV